MLLGQERYAEAAETVRHAANKEFVVLEFQYYDTLASKFYASEAHWKMGKFDEALELGHQVLK